MVFSPATSICIKYHGESNPSPYLAYLLFLLPREDLLYAITHTLMSALLVLVMPTKLVYPCNPLSLAPTSPSIPPPTNADNLGANPCPPDTTTSRTLRSNNIDSILHTRGFADVIHVQSLPHHFHELRALRFRDGTQVILKCSPSSHKPQLRFERRIIRDEICIHALLATADLPLPRMIACREAHQRSNSSFLATGVITGIAYSSIYTTVGNSTKKKLNREMYRYMSTLAGYQSPTFGPVSDVARGEGYKTWPEAFTTLFESVLMDGEDLLISLPYIHIRKQIQKMTPLLIQVPEASLILPSLRDFRNILVDRHNLQISGFLDLGWLAIWGDKEMSLVLRDTGDANSKPKLWLYKCFWAVVDIVHYQCRPPSAPMEKQGGRRSSELDAWKELNENLMALRRIEIWELD